MAITLDELSQTIDTFTTDPGVDADLVSVEVVVKNRSTETGRFGLELKDLRLIVTGAGDGLLEMIVDQGK